jgi:hypothetical protein
MDRAQSRSVLIAIVLLVTLTVGTSANLKSTDAQNDGKTLVVVHPPYSEQLTGALKEMGEIYAEEAGISLEFVSVAVEEIAETIAAGIEADGAYDVAILPHDIGAQLQTSGTTNAYCLEEQCEECGGPNPPGWCSAAMGKFDDYLIKDFSMAGYCDIEGCSACDPPTPRPWCSFAQTDLVALGLDIDVPRAATSILVDSEVFSYGIPFAWDFPVVLANPAWFEGQGLDLPANVEELSKFLTGHTEDVYICLDCGGVVIGGMPLDALPFPYIDTVPLPETPAAVVITPQTLAEFPGLFDEFADAPVPVALEDYHAPIEVLSAYALPGEQRELAMGFAYALAEENFQISLYERTGLLPANGAVLQKVAEGNPLVGSLVGIGKAGYLSAGTPMNE